MSRKATFTLFVPIVIVMVVVDRLTKAWAADDLSFDVVGPNFGIVDITLVHNRGAAFGFGQGNGWIFILITVLICAFAIAWLALGKKHHPIEVIGLALVVSGGIGNLIDRVTTVYVVDFLHFTFIDFPVFNVADICVTCGVVLFIVTFLFVNFRSPEETDVNGAAQDCYSEKSEPRQGASSEGACGQKIALDNSEDGDE